jgi:hypothetical protein
MRPSGTPRAGVKIRLVARRRRRCLLSPDSSLRGGAAAWALHCCVEHASTPAFLPVGSPGDLPACEHDEVEVIDIEKTHEAVDLVERVCALDIGKAALTVCIRVPHEDKPGHRRQEVREHATTTRSLLDLAARLHAAEGTLVAMKATSDYWKPAFYRWKPRGSPAGCSTPGTSRASPAALRPTSWMRCGWPRWSSEVCAGQASCRQPRSAGCGT